MVYSDKTKAFGGRDAFQVGNAWFRCTIEKKYRSISSFL